MIWKDILQDTWRYYNLDPSYDNQPGNAAGGSLHIILDDGNIEDNSVQYCIQYAIEHKDRPGENLARKLLLLSWRQRARLYLNYHLYCFGSKRS